MYGALSGKELSVRAHRRGGGKHFGALVTDLRMRRIDVGAAEILLGSGRQMPRGHATAVEDRGSTWGAPRRVVVPGERARESERIRESQREPERVRESQREPKYQSSGPPQRFGPLGSSAPCVLIVRRCGSQMVAVGLPASWVELAAPTGHRLNFRAQNGSFLYEPHGIGPREEPSQVLQPIAQPLLNPARDEGSWRARWRQRA
jgi:hypothetical protein